MTCEICGALDHQPCESCGAIVHVGSWPFCPHERVAIGRGADVTWPGGRTFEHLAHEPKTFYSPNELKAYLKQTHQEECVRHVPVPGTDKSPHTTSWSAISQYTLDAAKAMLERPSKPTTTDWSDTWVDSFVVTTTEEVGTVRAPRGTFDAT